jgi:peptide/nickel transport system substrate-binding protein
MAAGVAAGLIEKAEAPDSRTLTVTWAKPFVGADMLFTTAPIAEVRLMPLPRHILDRDFAQAPGDFRQLPYWTKEFVGVGPFKLNQYVEGSHMVLRANDAYVLGRPKIDEIEIKFMPDTSTIAANLLAGAVDITLGARLTAEWGVQVRDTWREGRMELYFGSGLSSFFPQLLTPDPAIVAVPAFRAALLHATDRELLSDVTFAGLAPVAHSLVGASEPEYAVVDPHVVKYAYDPRRATQILDGLGLSRGPDGFYGDPAGRRITVGSRARAGDELQQKTTTSTADMWQRIGIAVEQEHYPPQRGSDRQFRSTNPSFENVRQPGGVTAISRYTTAELPLPENGFRGNNRSRYSNPEFDDLAERINTTIRADERTQLVAQAINHMTTNLVTMPLTPVVDAVMISNRLTNLNPNNVSFNVHEWDVN